MKTKLLLLLLLANFSIYAQTNLVPNGGLEVWGGNASPKDWTITNTVFLNSDSGQGSYSATLMYNTLSPKITAKVPMKAGVTYTVKFKYKYVQSNYSGSHPIAINISGAGSGSTISSSTFAKDNLWTEKATTFTADMDLSYDLSISTFSFDAEKFDVLIDAVQVYVEGTEEYTLIPDVNFEKKLIARGLDSGATDGKVLNVNINQLTFLNVSMSSIADLTGIAGFTALTSLDCNQTGLKTLDISKNTNLTNLDCHGNSLKTIDVSKNTNLTFLDCSSNALPTLNVTSNTALKYLLCGNNGGNNTISALDVSQNINILELELSRINLVSLDVTKNTALQKLDISSSVISTIDLSKNTALKVLMADDNKLTTLDVSKNILLEDLNCSSNQLTSLDLSANTALLYLNCSKNKLTSLNLKNGNNSKFLKTHSIGFMNMYGTMGMTYDSSFINNINLNCIQVDNTDYSKTNWPTLKNDYSYFSSLDCSISTIIPDSKFEDKLIALQIDKDGKNGSILNSSINSVTTLDVSNSSIVDLTGIEGFNALTNLNTSGNALNKLDLSKNTALNTLNSSNNPALTCIKVADLAAAANWTVTKDATTSFSLDCNVYTLIPDSNFEDSLIASGIDRDGKNGKVITESIDKVTILNVSAKNISDLTGIQDFKSLLALQANNNILTKVDLSKNLALTNLEIYNNKLTSLDLSKNTALKAIDFESNLIQSIDFTKNTEITYIYGATNKLINLDVSQNTKLTSLFVQRNILLSLDISKNLLLSQFYANNNQIRNLDISKNSKLTSVVLNNNRLSNLKLNNGSNNSITGSISFLGNPDLACIQVDDAAFSNTNWADKKDANAVYSTTACSTVITYTLIPDSNFEDKLIALGIDKDGKNGKVETMNIVALTSLNVTNSKIADLTGIADFTSLTSLECSENQLKTINVSKNPVLAKLNVSKNQLTSLSITDNKLLSELNVSNNALTSLYLSDIPLTRLNCSNNVLNSLDVSSNTNLIALSASFNKIRNLNVSKNTKLKELDCASNDMYNLNLKNGNNTNMQSMFFGNFTENPNLLCIQVDDAAFSTANWIAKDAIANYSTEACGNHTGYTTIPDTKFEDKLIALKIDKDGKNGKVATMSIATLTSLNVSNSEITDLTGIADFTLLASLDCSNNSLTKIDLSKNLALTNINVTKNQLPALDLSKNTKLTILSASFNKILNLDVSKNTALKEIDCASNNMHNLNLKNGNNVNMQRVIFGNFTQNPNLLCIQVDDADFSKANWIAKDATASYSTDACPVNVPYTLIPDPNFEKILISQGVDKDGVNGKVATSSISNITQLNVYNTVDKITDLTGIEDFTSLQTLDCSNNKLTSLNLSKNTKLTYLNFTNNTIATVDVSANTALTSLYGYKNLLTTIDISKNTALKIFSVYNNNLTAVDITKNIALTNIELSNNQLTSVDITKNINLTYATFSTNQLTTIDISKNLALSTLYISSNQLSNLDVSVNTLLKEINASNNQIETLDISSNTALTSLVLTSNQIKAVDLSKNTALKTLDISKNKLTTLDVSKNTALTGLAVNNNELTSVNLQNGKNSLMQYYNLYLNSNPKLYCILVDDVTYANTNWSGRKDSSAVFNIECTGELTLPFNNFTIETKGETCLGENNGEINITAKQAFAYTATINDKATAFTDNALKLTALTPGIYVVKITIPGQIFEQNFTLTIAKAATTTGKSSVTSKKVDVEITEGTAPFTVYVDGQAQFETSESNFSLDLNKGGLLEVATAKACEGVYSKKILSSDVLGALAAYPNPTSGSFEIEIPTDKNEVKIELYNFGGQLVSQKNYSIENGKAQLNLENQPSGIYAAKIYLETPEYIKIIKK